MIFLGVDYFSPAADTKERLDKAERENRRALRQRDLNWKDQEDRMSEDSVRKAIHAIREFGVSYGPRETTIKVALMEGAIHEILGTAARALEKPSLPHPDSLDTATLFAMWDAQAYDHVTKCGSMRAAYQALYDHLTKPKTKMVQVWRVEYAYNSEDGWFADCKMGGLTEREAEILADKFRLAPSGQYACIRVTGPHAHEVPA